MKRILIIDDEYQVRSMLRMMLEHAGYEVEDAPDGEIGIKLYRKSPTDLVITDILMPKKEGIETIMEIRRDFPNARIIAISCGGRLKTPDIFLSMAERFGAARVFAKPLDKNKLLDAVRELAGA